MAVAWQATGGQQNAIASTTISPSWPSHLTNDIGLLFVESQANATSLSTANGFALLGSSVSATGTRLDVFWCRATSNAMSAPVVAGNSDHHIGVIITYRGCVTSGVPFSMYQTATKNTASTTDTAPAVITTDTDQLIVVAITKDLDSAAAFASGQTNSNLTSINERFDTGTTSGNGGGISVMDAVMPTVGSTGTTAITVTSSTAAMMTIALKGTADISQSSFRFYEDGTENGSTATDTQDTNITRNVDSDSNIQLRTRLQNNVAAAYSAVDDYQLQYSLNGDVYRNVGLGTVGIADSYSESNQDNSLGFFMTGLTQPALSQSFTGDGKSLVSIKAYISRTGTNSGRIAAFIYAHSGTYGTSSVPTGSPLDVSNDIDVSTIGTSLSLLEFVFGNQITLTNGTRYVLVIAVTTIGTGTGVAWGVDLSSPTHGGNAATANANYTWTANSGRDMCFYVYTADSTGSAVNGFNSGSLTDGNATTNRLGAGSGSFVAGKISEDGIADNLQITASNYTEFLYSLTMISSSLADNDTLDFRVVRNGVSTPMTYSVTPRITADKTTSATVSPNDIANSLTIDATTISQNHIVADADLAIATTADNTTITQNHVIVPADIAIGLTEDATTVVETNFSLTVQDVAIALTEDADTITQNHVVASNDVAIALTTDNDTISQVHDLSPADVAIALTEDNTTVELTYTVVTQDVAISLSEDATTISQNHVVSVNDVAVALTEDNDSLTQVHSFAPADVAIALTEDATTVTETNFNLTVQDVQVSLTEDSTTLSQNHVVAGQDVALALTADNTSLTQVHGLAPADLALALTEDSTTVTETNFILIVQDVLVTLTEDNATLTQIHVVASQDAQVSLSTDNTTLTQVHAVSTQDVAVGLTIDNATIADSTESIVPQNVTVALTADNTTITQNHVVAVQDVAVALTEDAGSISQNHDVAPADVAVGLALDDATITQAHSLTPTDIAVALGLDVATFTQAHVLASEDIALALLVASTSIDIAGAVVTLHNRMLTGVGL